VREKGRRREVDGIGWLPRIYPGGSSFSERFRLHVSTPSTSASTFPSTLFFSSSRLQHFKQVVVAEEREGPP
jgi:hypothetical protein